MKNGKRILSVTVRRMIDESPDTSWLGEYSNRPETEYAIDRAHESDCPVNSGKAATHNYKTESGRCANCDRDQWDGQFHECEDFECACIGGNWNRREYRYFNACVENYKGESPEDIRKYVRQDYGRMESLNRGEWCFIGIRAEAEVQVGSDVVQRITSGGLWGVESDSDKDNLESTAREELAQLKTELIGLGFSRRAIATAFKNVHEKGD
jgi:hypothetical protein